MKATPHIRRRRMPALAVTCAAYMLASAAVSLHYEPGVVHLVLQGSPIAPPMFIPVVLLVAAALASVGGRRRIGGLVLALDVGVAILLGSTFNLRNDLHEARAHGIPQDLPKSLAAVAVLLEIGRAHV